MKYKWVKQKHSRGCVIASLAVISGLTYDAVYESLKPAWIFNDKNGLDDDVLHSWLANNGYAWMEFNHEDFTTGLLRAEWPIKPFAPVHICTVLWEEMHAVVMLNDGKVLDPLSKARTSLDCYERIYDVTGIYKIGE